MRVENQNKQVKRALLAIQLVARENDACVQDEGEVAGECCQEITMSFPKDDVLFAKLVTAIKCKIYVKRRHAYVNNQCICACMIDPGLLMTREYSVSLPTTY